MGNYRETRTGTTHGSSALLATSAIACRAQGRSDPRPTSYICVSRREQRSVPTNARTAVRSQPNTDNRPVCASRAGHDQASSERRLSHNRRSPIRGRKSLAADWPAGSVRDVSDELTHSRLENEALPRTANMEVNRGSDWGCCDGFRAASG